MSLPTYRSEQLAESTRPLWQAPPSQAHTSNRESLESTSESLPGYPPASSNTAQVHSGKGGDDDALRRRHASTTARGVEGYDTSRQCGNTIFTFMPRYPMKAEEQSVYAPLSIDKLQTTLLLQQGIPFLATYPAERFEYFIPLASDISRVHSSDWVPIMDEAWEMLASDPPKRVKVQIIEEPKETEQRTSRDNKHGLLICAFMLVLTVGLFGFLGWLMTHTPNKPRE